MDPGLEIKVGYPDIYKDISSLLKVTLYKGVLLGVFFLALVIVGGVLATLG